MRHRGDRRQHECQRIAHKGADPLGVPVAIAGAFAAIGAIFFGKAADREDLRRAVRTVTEVHLKQSKVAAIDYRFYRYWFIGARQQDDESVGEWLARIFR